MMYLLDTNIVSLLAPQRRITATEVEISDWIERVSSDLFLSVITIAEVETGIAKLYRTGATAKALNLAAWLEQIVTFYSVRIFDFDLHTARVAGRLYDRAMAGGIQAAFPDAAIAATAKVHGLTAVTRNAAHFRFFDVAHVNPYNELPAHD